MKLLLLPLIATALVAAQTGPESVTRASFTSGEKQKLYINGGRTQTVGKKAEGRPGFFSLDLSTAWSKATPAWKKLDPLPRLANQTGEANIVLSKDGATLYVSQGLNFLPYTLATGVADEEQGMDEDMGSFTLGPIRDTDSGKLYGVGACRIDNSTTYGAKPQCVLSTYDPLVGRLLKTSSFSGLEFGHGDLPNVQGVYSSSTKLLYFLNNSTDFAGVSGDKATISQYDDKTRSVVRDELFFFFFLPFPLSRNSTLNFACALAILTPRSKPPAPLVRPLMPAAVPALLPVSILSVYFGGPFITHSSD